VIRKRFPATRVRRLMAWTGVTVACGTAVVARTVGAPVAEEPVADLPEPEPLTSEATIDAHVAVPTLPDDGLVVLRYTPAARPQPEVRRVVVSTPAAASAPTHKTSSGS
jgi:hypothetical protein